MPYQSNHLNQKEKPVSDLEKLEWIHFAIQEAMNGNTGELSQALSLVEDLREPLLAIPNTKPERKS